MLGEDMTAGVIDGMVLWIVPTLSSFLGIVYSAGACEDSSFDNMTMRRFIQVS